MTPNWAGSDEHQRVERGGRRLGLVESDAGNNEKFSRANREEREMEGEDEKIAG